MRKADYSSDGFICVKALGALEAGVDVVFAVQRHNLVAFSEQPIHDNVPKTPEEVMKAKISPCRHRKMAATVDYQRAKEFQNKIRQWKLPVVFHQFEKEEVIFFLM